MVGQLGYTAQAANKVQSSLAGIATISFAAVVGGIGAMTASIAIASKATADWETQMMGLARVAIPEFDYTLPEGKAAFTEFSRAFQGMYLEIPVKNREELTKAAEPYALAGYEGQTLYGLTEKTLKMMQATNYELSGDDISNLVIKSAQINRKESGIDTGDPTKILTYSDNLLDAVLEVSNKYTISTKDLTNAVIDAGGSAVTRGNENDIPGQLAFYALLNQYGVRPDLMRTMLSSSVSTAGMAGDSTARIESALNKIGIQTRDAEGKKIAEFSRAEVASKLLGVTVDQYQKMANTDMNRTQIRLIDAIENLDADRLTKNALGTGMFGAYAGRETSKLGAGGAEETYTKMEAVAKAAYTNGDQVESQYQNMLQTINSQWDLMTQRLHSVKEVFGEIFQGPVLAGIKSFSESAKGAVEWLTKIVDGSRNLDGTVNTWEAIGKVVDGLKEKFSGLGKIIKTALAIGGIALVASSLAPVAKAAGTVALAFGKIAISAGLAVASMIFTGVVSTLSGISLAVGSAAASVAVLTSAWLTSSAAALTARFSFLSAWSAAVGPVLSAFATVAAAAATLAAGLAIIGYALAPEKFTYFNQLATEAINGVSVVVKQLYTDLSTGDWSAAATHLKDAFMATIVWLQGIDWGRLGGEIVTMIGDGAYALINGALNLGGWIYDSLSAWVNGGGPYALGESIANFISSGVKTLGNVDYWAIIKGAFKAVGDWISLGWDIISGIGSGVLSGVSSSFAPAAHSIVEVFYTAVYSIEGAFARLWNTLLVGGVNIANQIGTAFAGIGQSLDGAVTTILDKVDTLKNNIPGLSSSSKSSGSNKNPSGDYDDSQTSVKAKKSSSTYTPSSTDYAHSSTTINKDQSMESVNRNNISLSSEAEAAAKAKTNAYKNPVGYMTGGKGIIADELKPVYDKSGKISAYIMTNLKGQPITASGHEQWSVENMQKYGKYLMEYETDPRGAAKIRADELVPLETFPKEVKKSSDYQKNSAISSTNILKDGIFQNTVSWKDTTDYSSKNTISATDFVNSTTRNTAVETSSITKKAVAESYSPVKIGLTESGQKIAVIGKVAQQQFEQSGNKWMNDTGSAGVTFNSDTTSGGKSIRSDVGIAGDELIGKVAGLQLGGSIKGMFDGNDKSYENPSTKEFGSTVASIIGGSIAKFFGAGSSTTQTTPDQLLRNVEDITCTGDRVMVNTGIYTSPTGEKSAFNPMDNEGARLISGNVEGEFTDMTCMGQTVTINGLKYTNPYGVSSYINPMEYNGGGGVLDYQQQSNTTINAAKDAGKVTVDSAKTSSEYQKGSTNYQAQSIQGTTQRWVTTNEYMLAKEENAAIQNGEMWRNNVDFFTSSMDATYFRFDKMNDENVKQAYDYMGSEATVNDKKYQQNMETIKLYEEQISGMRGVNSQLGGLVSSIDSAGANLNASFGSMLASLSASMGNRSGAFGGTSIGGGGQYVGMGSTNPANAVPWGGTAASIYAQMNSTMPRFGSVSWGAKGSLIEEPTRLIAGEKGRELLLPNNLTELFMKLAALGFNNVNGNGGSGDTVVIVNIDGEQVEKVVSRRQKRNLNLKGLKLH